MKKRLKLTIGNKLTFFYLFLFAVSFFLIQTVGHNYIYEMVVSETRYHLWDTGTAELVHTRVDYYFNILLTLFYFMSAVMGCAFLLIYLSYSHVLRKIQNGAKKLSVAHENEPIPIYSNDEFGELANTLNILGEEMAKQDEYQRKFISNISHDFRSPLTSIRGYVQAISDGIIPPEVQDKYLNIILFETDRLTKLTSDILNMNSLNENHILLEISDFDIHTAIRNTINTLEGNASHKNIVFETEFSTEKALLVTADSDKIQQVLHNLMENAIKFSHNDSKIFVSTRVRGEKVFISVKDTGIGIPKEETSHIWDRFYKTDLSRGKDKFGTGLGLSICKEIINAHKQTIHVVSTVGVGSEFVFTLPKK
jgi:signal transduction histidine kinase